MYDRRPGLNLTLEINLGRTPDTCSKGHHRISARWRKMGRFQGDPCDPGKAKQSKAASLCVEVDLQVCFLLVNLGL